MSEITINRHPQFFTATILEWKHLLVNDAMKDIIISSLRMYKTKQMNSNNILQNHRHLRLPNYYVRSQVFA